jgi:hypothetical protein
MRLKQNLIWFVEFFTQAKSFKDNPIIGSKTMNRMGLHVFRLFMAHLMTRFRWCLLFWRLDKKYRDEYHRQGFVVIENFLPNVEFETLSKQLRNVTGGFLQCRQGDTLTQRHMFEDIEQSAAAYLAKDKRLKGLFRYGGSANHSPLMYIEHVNNGVLGEGEDPQKKLHSDTFHPTVKAWLYLDDVTEVNGPLEYVEGSNKLTWKRIKWEYQKSLTAATSEDSYTQRGSFRARDKDLTVLGLPQPKAFKVKKNTLVFANTYGFHRRGKANKGSTRMSVYMQDRANPFWGFFALDYKLFQQWRIAYLKNKQEENEYESAQRGRKPMWQPVDLKDKKEAA